MEQIFVVSCLLLMTSSIWCSRPVCAPDNSGVIGEPIFASSRKRSGNIRDYISFLLSKADKRQPDRNEPFFPENPLPWTCHSETIWRDLGENFYPRFIKDASCLQERCWYGYYLCKPQIALERVLKRNDGQCVDTRLPTALHSDWQFVNIDVIVGCLCSR